jgi:hypothetical protein
MRYTGKLVQQALSSMLEILKQEVGEGQFCQRVHWVHQQVVSVGSAPCWRFSSKRWVRVSFVIVFIGCIGKLFHMHSTLKILNQEVGEGQFCQCVHWVYLQIVSHALSSMLEILKQEVGEGHFRQRVHWVHRQVVSYTLSSMLKILKQEVGEGQFCQRVHWVYLQNSFKCT